MDYYDFDDPDLEQEPISAMPVMQRGQKGLGSQTEMTDLDVTPVMNLFMVLIPFLVSMAVFTQIAIVDFSLPPASSEQGGEASETKELDISVVVSKNGFRIVGTGKKLDLVPLLNQQYQYEVLKNLLQAVKFEYPSQKSVVLVIEQDVIYEDVIHFMDACREAQFPDIGLSGEIG